MRSTLWLSLLLLIACNGAQAGGQSGTESDRPVCGCDPRTEVCRTALPAPDGGELHLYADDAGADEDDAGDVEVTATEGDARDQLTPDCDEPASSD